MPFGSCTLLVIQVNRSKIDMSEERVATSKLPINQWRNDQSSRDQLGQHLAFTTRAQEPGNYDESTIPLCGRPDDKN
jgi:hypothetical protein